MSRNQFLKFLWFKFLEPAISIAVILILGNFTIKLLTVNGLERTIAYAACFLGLTKIILEIFDSWSRDRLAKVRSRITLKTKRILKISATVFNYLLFLMSMVILYLYWQDDWVMTSFIILLLLALRVVEFLYKDKKQA